MHVPDGFLDVSTSLATGAIAIGAVGTSLIRAEPEIRRAGPALPGLTAAFIFAVQMVNFPVGAGTSGHLLGGALAAVLVGPWTAVLCLSVVLIVQALLFADGGLTALGTNITLMATVTVLVGYAAAKAARALLPARPGSVVPAAALGAFLSVPASALVFVLLYAVGGTVDIPLAALSTAMLGWHALIGIGEAVITAAVVSALVATRPDLVYLARDLRPALVVAGSGDRPRAGAADTPATGVADAPQRASRRTVLSLLGLATVAVAGVVSLAASALPDGLEHVAQTLGFGESAQDSAVAGSPLADYSVAGLDSAFSTGLAGLLGVLAVVVVAGLLATAVRAVRATTSGPGHGTGVVSDGIPSSSAGN